MLWLLIQIIKKNIRENKTTDRQHSGFLQIICGQMQTLESCGIRGIISSVGFSAGEGK